GAGDADRAGGSGAADAAVAVGVLGVGEVLLVVVLGEVERAGRDDLGGDRAVAGAGQHRLEGVPGGLGGGLLGVGVVEDHRAVLGADVVALAEALGGVVALPEDLEQVGVGDLLRVEDDADRLGVAGGAGADLFVGRVGGVSALVADGGGDDSALGAQPPEGALHAPEAAHAEVGDLAAGRVGRGERGAQHLVAVRHGHRGVPAGERLFRFDHGGLAPEREHGSSLSGGGSGAPGAGSPLLNRALSRSDYSFMG